MNNQISGFPFPANIRQIIFNKLDGISLGKCQRVCRQFKGDIGKCELLWKNNFVYEHHGYVPARPVEGWRAFYIQQDSVMRNMATNNFGKPVKFEDGWNNIQSGFTYGDRFYVVGNDKRSISCFSLSTGKLLKTISDLPESTYDLSSIDSNHFTYRSSTQISIWDASQDTCVFAQDNVMGRMVVPAEGTTVLFYTIEGHLQVWDFKSKKLIKQIDGVPFREVYPKKDSKLIGNVFFVLMSNGQVRGYDIEKGQHVYTMESGNDCPFTKLLATDKYLIAINSPLDNPFIMAPIDVRNRAYIYEAVSGKLIHTIELSHPDNPYAGQLGLLAEISQNQLVGIPRNNTRTVACWDLETGEIVKKFTPPMGTPYFFKVGGPDRLVITTTALTVENIGVTIWDLNNEALLSQTQYKGCSNYLLDGTRVKIHNQVMYFGDWPKDKFHFWDLISAREIGTFAYDTAYDHSLIIWHFDGARFIVGGAREGVQIYDLSQVPQKNLFARLGKGIMSMFRKN